MAEKQHKIFYGWYVVASSFVTLFMTTGIGFYTFSVFMLPLEQHFGVSRTAVSLFNMIIALVAGFATPVIGVLVHSWGPRKVIGLGSVVVGAGYVLLSMSATIGQLYGLAFLIGVGLSATTLIPNQTIISHWFVKRRGTAMGIMMMGVSFGGIVWAPLAHSLIARFRWQGAFAIFGIAIPVVLVPLAIFIIRRSPESMGLKPDGDGANKSGHLFAPGAGLDVSKLPNLTVPQAVRTASFWYLFLVNFFMVLGTAIVTAHTVAMVTDSALGMSLGRQDAMRIGSRVITYFLVVSIAGRFFGGVLAERFSKRFVMCAHYVVMILAALLLFQLNSMTILYLFVILYGLGMGGSAVIYPLILAENFGLLSFSKLLGIMGIPFTLGAAIGVVGAARIYDVMKATQGVNPYAGVFILLVCVFTISSVLVAMAKPPRVLEAAAAPAQVEQEPA